MIIQEWQLKHAEDNIKPIFKNLIRGNSALKPQLSQFYQTLHPILIKWPTAYKFPKMKNKIRFKTIFQLNYLIKVINNKLT